MAAVPAVLVPGNLSLACAAYLAAGDQVSARLQPQHTQCKPDDSDTITAPSSPTSSHRISTPAVASDHAAKISVLVSSGGAAWQTWATGDLLQAACDWLSVGAEEQSREQRVWSLAEDALQEHLDSGEARAQHQWDWDIFRCCSCCAPVTG